MSLRKRLKNFRDWCPQPSPTRLPAKLKSYSVPLAAVIVATVALGVFLSLPSLQKIPTQPVPQLPQNLPENSTQPLPTPTPTVATPTTTPTPTSPPAPPPPTLTQVTATNGNLELTMSIQKTVFEVGEPVNIALAIVNISNQTVNLTDSAWLLDFIVGNSTNNIIYKHTSDGAMSMTLAPITLDPGQNITQNYVWTQRYSGSNPGPASSGTYYIIGKSDPSHALQTDPLEIRIGSA
jgi:hypothetical protein